jgi:hypothetical protein
MPRLIGRRRFLRGAGAVAVLGAVGGCRWVPGVSRATSAQALQLAPLRAGIDRITRVTVCTRPFRAQGPRLDVETVGAKTVVHNYGLFYNQVGFVPRRDGLVFQVTGEDDYYGYDDDTEVTDRAEAERAVNTIASLFGELRPASAAR